MTANHDPGKYSNQTRYKATSVVLSECSKNSLSKNDTWDYWMVCCGTPEDTVTDLFCVNSDIK